MTKEQIGQNLREFAEKNFSRLKDLADNLDMKESSLQTYLKGDSFPGAKILQKLDDLGCDIKWLLTGETSEERKSYIQEIELPILADVSAGLGELSSYDDFPETYTLHYDKRKNYIVRVDKNNGESMKPFIQEGDLIVVENTPAGNNELAVVSWIAKDKTHKGAIKMIQYSEDTPDYVALISYNQAFPIIPLDIKYNEVQIHKVVMIIKSK